MQLERRALRSKIARRIFGLFVLSALAPVLMVATLSFFQVTDNLTKQKQTQLRHLSKNYGMAVLDKLLRLEASAFETSLAHWHGYSSAHLRRRAEAQFEGLLIIRPSGKTMPVLGRLRDWQTVSRLFREPLAAQLKIVPSSGSSLNPLPRILLGIALHGEGFESDQGGANGGLLLAEVKSNYLWADQESLPAMTDLCIFGVNARHLYCSSQAISHSIRNEFPQQPLLSNGDGSEWVLQGKKFLIGRWNLFLESQFAHPNLTFVAIQPKSFAFVPIQNFRWMFSTVILLSVLLVILLSIGQIRRSLIPLQKLKEGTQNIAKGNFRTTIAVESDDEFGDLAQAFNAMANRLGRLFHTLDTLAQIDQLILAKPSFDHVAKTVLQHFSDIVPCEFVSLVITGHDAIGPSQVYSCAVGGEPWREPVALSAEETQALLANPEPREVPIGTTTADYLRPLAKRGARISYLLPILKSENLAGLAILGYQKCPNLTQQDLSQVRDLADRVAVAIAAAEREQQLYRQAHYDSLTNLPNRQLLKDRLRQEITHAQRQNYLVALLFVDLDRFKKVNDSLGHAAGDELLLQVAERLRDTIRDTDTVARLGGDEFTIILSNIHKPRDAGRVAENIIDRLAEPFVIRGQENYIGASIGIAVYPHDGDDPAVLLRSADTAMYRAKQTGRGQYLFFQEEMNAQVVERANLERDLRAALERGEFTLFFQPQLDLRSGKITSAEVLIRWRHPERGLVPPDTFISIAEDSGLIVPLGEWVMRAACRQYRRWRNQGIDLDRLAVNVSSRQFKQQDFLTHVRTILTEEKMAPQGLELEITESLFAADIADIESIFESLRDLGVRLAIDDFGTGYSSLSYLKRFPVNALKVDRAFMRNVPDDRDAAGLVQSIIGMAHNLNREVVAEGIETEEQLCFLRRNGCEQGQGYYLSRPLPAPEFVVFLNQFETMTV